MKVEKIGTWGTMWLWIGAAVSIAEIMTGALFAPLGIEEGLTAMLVGRGIGVCILLAAGYVGAKSGRNAMESVEISFGKFGRIGFSVLNVLQLVGWTAVMIVSGASGVALLVESGDPVVKPAGTVGIGVLIALWLFMKASKLIRVNSVIVILLAICCAYVTWRIFTFEGIAHAPLGEMSFGTAVELSVAMPLSWIPLIADYSKEGKNPVRSNLVGALSYGVGGFWMSAVGLASAVYTGYADVAALMGYMGLGAIGFFIVVLSTVTTTYLDVKSGVISYGSVSKVPGEKTTGLAIILLGVGIALFADEALYINFLYYIGSCFAPMVGVMLTDYFLLRNTEPKGKALMLRNTLVWLTGFVGYRYLIEASHVGFDTPIGISIPVIFGVGVLAYVSGRVFSGGR